MDIQAEKLEVMKLILETNNPGLIKSIKKLLSIESSGDFWDDLSEDQKQEILGGLDELDEGKTFPYEEIMKHHRK